MTWVSPSEAVLRIRLEVKSVANFEMWDGLFHQTLMASCHNQLLIDIYDAINAVRRKADWARLKERVMTPARRQSTHKQHRKIMAALRARDPEGAAVAMMKQHDDETCRDRGKKTRSADTFRGVMSWVRTCGDHIGDPGQRPSR